MLYDIDLTDTASEIMYVLFLSQRLTNSSSLIQNIPTEPTNNLPTILILHP